ncbi:iron-containing alcohol dehydrogenase [Bacteroidales bacterium OttesenSCG-928-K03]|nr:iron-containing alcohol dehydrogenase [Odoribacter sp. OttesenSCG-928-L07]MDL2238793.1 iron-containing alcohol dehydrogenase [Bacteroidales bacterium OttesenSCG-928-L14]MDL2240790.1 iron-containing alcohol dehydrogenase [Bacteroidales bacterium OttesenSCG-928-K22]MDL2242172.1 iron-containing alcohol dehydrogenase [Bacteroidales bacterium OttesenSCG-928-K03]
MKNFTFHNPTKLIFGKGQISKLSSLIPKDKKVMITFGGGSVKKNGVYEQVVAALKEHNYIEFWGIEPNPTVETLRKAITLGKENNIDFILAVGGGSVLDGTKLIASAIPYSGDAWEIVLKGKADNCIPFASVMTLPATGSEMNNGGVISRSETKEKYAFNARYPEFSILDPETTYSLPPNQVANGLADIYVHVMEQYLTTPGQSRVMDRWAEGILLTVLEIAPKIKENQHDYDTMADFMLSATMALNDFIRMGVTQDWATHMIGHELTAFTGIAHGASLAIVLPGTMYVMREQKKGKILQYGERIFNITEGTEDEKIILAIKKTEDFFKSIGLATTFSEAKIDISVIDKIVNRFKEVNVVLGESRNITAEVVREILGER